MALLETLCHDCPELKLELWMVRCFEDLDRHHRVIIKHLVTLHALRPLEEEFVSLEHICMYNPSIDVFLTGFLYTQELINYPALVKALVSVTASFSVDVEDLQELDSLFEQLPESTDIRLSLREDARQELKNCSHILARLKRLNYGELSSSEEDVVVFREVCELIPGLEEYMAIVPLSLLPCFLGNRKATRVLIDEDVAYVHWKTTAENGLEIIGCFRSFQYVLNQAALLREATNLVMSFDELTDDTSTLFLLQDLPVAFPGRASEAHLGKSAL